MAPAPPGASDRGSGPDEAIFASFAEPGETLTVRLPGWFDGSDGPLSVRLTPMPEGIRVDGPVRVSSEGEVRFDIAIADDAAPDDLSVDAVLLDGDGHEVASRPARVTLHVMPDLEPVRITGSELDVDPDRFEDGWLAVEANLEPGEHLAVVPYDPRERFLLTRLRLQAFGFDEGGDPLTHPAGLSLSPTAASSERSRHDPHLAHLEREQRFLEQVDRFGLEPLGQGEATLRPMADQAHRRFAVPDFISGGTSYVDTTLRATSDHALVYVQDDHTPAEYERPRAVAAAFDSVYSEVRALWGEESDVDGNGRVILVVTPLTDSMTVVNTADLYGGNRGEIIYGPSDSRPLLAHEFTHLITNYRKRVLQGIRPPTWEVEGIAVASEILLGLGQDWVFRSLLERPWNARAFSPYAGPALLVLAAGERGGGSAEGAWLSLHDTTATGKTLLEEVAGVPFEMLMGDVAMALLLDETPYQTERYSFEALDMRQPGRPTGTSDGAPPLAYDALPVTARAADLVNLRPFVSGPATGGEVRVVVRLESARARLRLVRLAGPLPYRPDPERHAWRIEGGVDPRSAGVDVLATGRVGHETEEQRLTLFYEGSGSATYEVWDDDSWFEVSPASGTVAAHDPQGVPLTIRFAPCGPDDPARRSEGLNVGTNGASFAPTLARIHYECRGAPEPPTIHAFVAAANDVSPSSGTELRWAVSGQEPLEVRLEPGIGDVSGLSFLPVHPDTTTTYELRASNRHGETIAQLVIGACADPDAAVSIPDPNLADELAAVFDLASPTTISCRQMAGLEKFEPSTSEIVDLTGLEAAVGLKELRLSGNRIADFGPLAELTNLRLLRVAATGMTDPTPLAGLTNLSFLEMNDNEVRDLSALAGLDRLFQLVVANNPLASTDPLADLASVRFLALDSTGARNLDFLAGLPQLIDLSATNNELTTLEGVQFADSLRVLVLANNRLEEIGPLLDGPAMVEGAFVNLRRNCLDVTPGSSDREVIDALSARGVEVWFDDQKEPSECGDSLRRPSSP